VVLITLGFDDCQNFLERLKLRQPLCHRKKTSLPLVRRAGENLKTMLRWGAKMGWAIRPQLLALLGELRLPKRATRDVIAPDEHIALLIAAAYGPKKRAKGTWLGHLYKRMMLELILWTNGARESELAAIHGRDIDRANGYIYISGSWDRLLGVSAGTKTEAGMRGRPMPEHVQRTLDEIWEMRGGIKDDELLFQPQRAKNGKPCKTSHASLSQWSNQLCEDAGLMIPNSNGGGRPLPMYQSRHSSAAQLNRIPRRGVTQGAHAVDGSRVGADQQ
jgi:integrase